MGNHQFFQRNLVALLLVQTNLYLETICGKSHEFINPQKAGVGSGPLSSSESPRSASWGVATISKHACTKRGPTPYSWATWAMGRLMACCPIASRKRTVVRLPRPQTLSLSVKALWHRKHQKRRLCSTNSTGWPPKGTSRLQRWRTSCCLTQTH